MDISFIGWIHTLIALIAILSGAYSLKKYTIIETKKTIKLHSLPIWDSLAVARENVFFTNQKGEVVCLGE